MTGVVRVRRRQFFTDVENSALRAALRCLIGVHGTQTRVAELIGIGQGTISAFLSGRHGATPGVARKIAQLSGLRLPGLLGWAEKGRISSDCYKNRVVAVEMARLAGLDEGAIAAVEAIRLGDEVIDQTVLAWFDRIRASS